MSTARTPLRPVTRGPSLAFSPELTPISLAMCLLVASPLGFALPTGPVNTSGQATVQTTSPGQMLIQQSTAKAGLDWTQFSIAAGERVQVAQPDRTSVLLNRVVGENPSLIYGALQSNGSVWLINPRGIVFGASSRVDVGGLVASTLGISNDALQSGRLQLASGAGGAGELRSEGSITAIDGSVVLVAPQLMHGGQIEARRVGLAAASEVLVDVEGDGLIFFNVKNESLDTRLQILGGVRADGGSAEFRAVARAGFADTVLNLEGVVQARSLGQQQGRIVVDGGATGITRVAGTLDASAGADGGQAGHGGSITVQGDLLRVEPGARMDATGPTGGGEILLGGDYLGANSAVRNATHTTVAHGAVLDASATQAGDGGRIIVWSDDTTRFDGSAAVRGGPAGGNGGFVETSGKRNLGITQGRVDVSAPMGVGGTWLLDPENIIVATVGGANYSDVSDASAAPGTTQTVSTATLIGVGGNVILAATNNITFSDPLALTTAGAGITATAGNAIAVNAGITTLNGAISLQSGSGGVTLNAGISSGNGAVTITSSGGTITQVAATAVNAGTGTIALNAGTGAVTLNGSLANSNTTASAIAITGATALQIGNVGSGAGGTVTLSHSGGGSQALGTAITGGSLVKAGSGTLTLDQANSYAGSTTVQSGALTLSSAVLSTTINVAGGTLSSDAADLIPSTADVTVATGATLSLGGTNTVGTLSLSGTLNSGINTLSASSAALSGGTLASALTLSGNATSTGSSVLQATLTAVDVAVNGGALSIGTGGNVVASGNFSVATGAELQINQANFSVGTLTGTGRLSVLAAGVTLTGTLATLTEVSVTGAGSRLILADGIGARINDAAAVDVGSGATLQLGDTAETVGALTLSGTLDGASALTAASATLVAASVNAALSVTGALSSSGSSTLTAAVTAATTSVTGGVLSVGNGGAGSLATTGTTSLSSGAELAYNGSGPFSLGNLTGTGVSTLRVSAGTLNLTGTMSTVSNIAVGNGGSLTLADLAARLGTGADVNVASGGTLTLGDTAESVAALTLGGTLAGVNALNVSGNAGLTSATVSNTLGVAGTLNATGSNSITTLALSGTLSGTGTVSAGTATLTGASVTSTLGVSGSLSSSGNSSLTGAVTAATTNVTGGVLSVGNGGAGSLATSGTTSLSNGAELAYNGTGPFTLGNLSGTGTSTLRVTAGTLNLNGTTSTVSDIAVGASGTLTLADGAARLGTGAALSVEAGGTLTLGNTAESAASLALGGTVGGSAGLTVQNLNADIAASTPVISNTVNATNATIASGVELSVGNGGGNGALVVGTATTVDGTLSIQRSDAVSAAALLGAGTVTGTGRLRKRGGNTLTLDKTVGLATVQIDGGGLTLSGANRIGDTATINVAAGATLTTGGNNQRVGTLNLSGTLAGSGDLQATTVTVPALSTGTVNGLLDADSISVSGSLVTGSANRINNGNDVTVNSGGSFTLGGTEQINSLTLAGALGGGFTLTANAGSSLGTGGEVLLGTTLTGGSLTVSGDATVNGRSNHTDISIGASGNLRLGTGGDHLNDSADIVNNGLFTLLANERIRNYGGSGEVIDNGFQLLTLTTTLTNNANNVDATNLITIGNIRIRGTVNVSLNALVQSGTLTIGNNTNGPTGTSGALNVTGTTTVAAGATLSYERNGGTITLPGSIAGDGTFRNNGTSTLNFTGTLGTANVQLNTGNITLAAGNDDRLADTANVTVAPGRTLTLNNATETLGNLGLSGTLAGSGVLSNNTAAGSWITTLNTGANVQAPLGVGTLTVSGSATLAAAAGSGNVTVGSTGALSVTTAGSLDAAANVIINTGGSLTLAANDTVATFNAGGSLLGSGFTLTTTGGTTLTSGAIVGANLSTAALNVTGNSTLNGTLSGATALTLSGGVLTLGSPQTVASFTSAGTLAGGANGLTSSGGLTLQTGAIVNANLGGVTLTVDGSAALNRPASSTTVNINTGGTLTTGATNVLAAGATVNVANGGTLSLGFSNDIGTLNLTGTLTGSGMLTASAPTGYVLTGGTVNAPLGSGALSASGSSILAAAAAVGSVSILAGGTLTFAPGSSFSATPTFNVAGNLALVNSLAIGSLAGSGNVALGAFTLTTGSAGNSIFNGTITGSGNLTKVGASTFTLGGSHGYTGLTTVSQGTLQLAASEVLNNASSVAVSGGATLALAGVASTETVASLSLSGSTALNRATLGGSGTLVAASYSMNFADTVAAAALGAGTLTATGSSLLGGSFGGNLIVGGGTLTLASAGRLADPAATVTVQGGATLAPSGTENVGSLTLAGTLAGAGRVNASAHTLQTGAVVDAVLGGGAATVTGDATLNGAAQLTSLAVNSGATLTLGGNQTVGSLALDGGLAGGFTLTATAYTLSGSANVAAATSLGAGTLAVIGGNSTLAGTSAAAIVNVDSGTLTLASPGLLASNAVVSVATPAALALTGNQTLQQLILSGTLAGTGTLTATNATGYVFNGGTANAALGSGALSVAGNSTLGASAAVGSVGVGTGGTLTIGAGGGFSAAPAVTIAAGGMLNLASSPTFGSLAGSGTLGLASFTLTTGNADNSIFDGIITGSGSGGLVKQGSGVFTLGGSPGYGGSTTVNAGTLALQGTNVLPDGSAVTVASGATLALNGADTVASLALAGTLSGSGTLSAGNYTLAAGATTTANANLGAGTLTINGNSTLAGAAAAGTVNIDAGTLTLASADRLADGAAVTVAGGATLALGGSDTIGSLTLAGTLAGSGQTLTATTANLQAGAAVNANLAGTTLNVGGNATLTGSSGATAVNVTAGTLTLAGAERLNNNANLLVANGATLLLGGTETVGTLTLAGTLGNPGRLLNATSYTLQTGASVLADLGAGILTSSGDATLTGTAAADTVNVTAGTLSLASANRLADTATLSIASGATLLLNGDDTVFELALSGLLDGIGTLSASIYTLSGGTNNTPLGGGNLTVSADSTLSVTSAATTVTVNGGTLTLGAARLFTARPAVNVNASAGLTLGGAEDIGSLAGAGTVTLGSFTLTHLGLADSNFSGSLGVAGDTGGLVKLGGSNFTLGGVGAYTGNTRVAAGTLTVAGTLASLSFDVDGGSLVLAGADRLADAASVVVRNGALLNLGGNETIASLTLTGTLAGSGTLSASLVALDTGIVNANLGGGTLTATGISVLNGPSAATTLAVNGGTLTLTGADRLTAAPATTVANAAMLVMQSGLTLGSLAGGGNVNLGSFTLTTGNAGDSSFNGVLSGSGGLTKIGTGIFTLGGSNSYLGATQVLAGSLVTSAADVLPNSTALTVASGATLTMGDNGSVATLLLNGALQGSGTLTAATYALNGGSANSALGAGVLTSTGSSSLGATSAATTVVVSSGTLTLMAANLLADGAAVSVASGATLALSGSDSVASLALAGTLGLTPGNSGTLTASSYTLDGATVDANLGAGTLASSGNSTLAGSAGAGTVQVNGGTLSLASAGRLADTAQVSVASGATLRLNGDDGIGSLALAGTLDGNGRLSASTISLNGGNAVADVGATTLSSSGSSRLAGGADVGALNVDSGTLTLASSAALSATSATHVATGATLALGGNQSLGTLAGAGNVGLGSFTLTTGSGGSSRFDGVISGTGGLDKAGTGTFTLGGANNYSGATSVLTGTLATAGADVLPDASATRVASGATLQLGGNDSVATLLLNGTLQGSATLSATTYTLDGGNAVANLGAGRLISTGSSTLAGSAAATDVAVNSGTLALAAANRLADSATVAIATGATLQLGGDDTIARADIAGTLAGIGTLNAATVVLASGRVDATLGGGVLSSSGNSQLNATSAATAFSVDGGTLTLSAAQLLLVAPSVTLAAGSRLVLAGDETFGSLGGAGDLTLGNTTLRTGTSGASSYAGSISGTGRLVKQGSGVFTLSGAHGYSGSTTVEAGTLALAGADLLPDSSAVSVAAGATLALTGNETVASLALSGILATTAGNNATLSAASYVLDGGNAMASLGAGSLQSIGASRLGGGSGATTVLVTSGTLALAAADRLADIATVTVASGATLTLAGNDTIASLALAGTLAGSGTLTAASYSLTSGTVTADLGTGALLSAGSSRLDGRSAATTLTVDSGSLTLGAADRLADSMAVTVASGAALVINATHTVASLALAGTLSGSGTLTATNTLLDGGRVDANLGGGTLTSRGSSTLAGTAAAATVVVEGGTLILASAQRLVGLPALLVNGGALMAFGGSQALGSLSGDGDLALASFTLTTGSGGDSIFAGVISGSGGLVKQGSSVFTVTGSNSYTGVTRIDAGTLRVGNGGTLGSLASSAFDTSGTLSWVRSDDITLAQPVSGSGNVEQAGNGRLLFSGSNKTYTGDTIVTNGELATAGADELPDGSGVRVAASGRLALGGRETVRSVDADGSISLGPELVASGDLLMRGAVSSAGAVQLSGQRIAALNEGNRFAGTVSVTAGGELSLSSGRGTGGTGTGGTGAGTSARDLVLGNVNAAAGGRVDGGLVSLAGVTTVTGGTLALVAAAPLTVVAPDADLRNLQAASLPIAFAADALVAQGGSRLNVAAGAGLNIVASNGGSVQLLNAGNSFAGNLSVVSGAPDTPWSVNSTALNFGGATLNYAVQSRVRITGNTVNIGGAGIVADVVAIRADRVSTAGTAAIVARLPFDSTAGTATALPALTLELTPAAFTLSFPFGAPGAEGGLRVSVGSREYGNRVLPLDAGYVAVLPRDGASGSTAVLLRGPVVNPSGGYRFFFDGAGSQTQIPVFYNGVLPTTPQVENSISATVAVSEGARKAGFDDAVRTENVALRLRAGVIAEVGPAPSATQGTEGLRVPASCTPAPAALLCGDT